MNTPTPHDPVPHEPVLSEAEAAHDAAVEHDRLTVDEAKQNNHGVPDYPSLSDMIPDALKPWKWF